MRRVISKKLYEGLRHDTIQSMIIREKTKVVSLGSFVKIVVDIEKETLAAGCELHMDCAEELVAAGSSYHDLWGANIYAEDGRIDFISMINIRPAQDNPSMDVQNKEIREKVESVVRRFLVS